jgi:hypothetical protein
MPRFYWQNVSRGTFRSLRVVAADRWEYLRLAACKLFGRPAWRFAWWGTLDASHVMPELDMSDGLLQALADVQHTLKKYRLRLACCLAFPTVHPALLAQSANFLSEDGLLGVAVFVHQWQGTRSCHYSCSTRQADGRLLATRSVSRHDLGCIRPLPSWRMSYLACPTLEPVLAAHRTRIAERHVVPWQEGEVERVVVTLWNDSFAYNERIGTLCPMTEADLVAVRRSLDRWPVA